MIYEKEDWLRKLYYSIEEISSHSIQDEWWFGKSEKYTSSYGECRCNLFDDFYYDQFLDKYIDQFGFDDELKNLLFQLRTELRSYDDIGKTNRDIFNDPE